MFTKMLNQMSHYCLRHDESMPMCKTKPRFRASFSGFLIDGDDGLFFEGRRLTLYPKELAVLRMLVQHAGRLVSKEELIAEVWNGAPTSDESIARCISVIKTRLRAASPGTDLLIKNEYGRGYRFIGQVSHRHAGLREDGLLALINASPDIIALKDGEGRWQLLNRAARELFGLGEDNWFNRTHQELEALIAPEQRSCLRACAASDEEAWQARRPSLSVLRVPSPAQGLRIFEISKSPVFHEDGSRRQLIMLGRDVTERTLMEERLRVFDEVLRNSREAVVITDADNNILSVNPTFCEITGYQPEEVMGKNPRILSSGRQNKAFYRNLWQQLALEGSWRGEIWNRRKNGEIYPEWLDISLVRDGSGRVTHHIAIFSDITHHKETERQLQFMAYHDPLTRLPNRLLLRDRFDQAAAAALRTQTRLALLFLDLDQFKHVNDTLGHTSGDKLLLGVAERLRACVRETDTISRLGGDEFVILLGELKEVETASQVAQKVLEQLAPPFTIDGQQISTSFSIGIGLFPDDGNDFDTLLKIADAAMYAAKDCGRNTYRYYTEQLNLHALERLHMQHSLRQAIERQEFVLHYQPQYELASGRLAGAEALIRWNCPERGLTTPDSFIPVAEECGLIVGIGEWVLREACRQNRAWQDAGHLPLPVAVNLSALQFRHGNLADSVRGALADSGLQPQWLELELTESILIQNVDAVLEVLRTLKQIGVRLSIDDFGTGYSSLAYIKRFALDKLKVDQSFVRNMAIDPDDAAIVHSVIQLGHSLKLTVVAEGVESAEQAEILRREGCDLVQGYLYARPLPPEQFGAVLERAASPVRVR